MPWPLIVAAIATAIGTGISAYSAISQGQVQSAMTANNARIARQNAALIEGQKGIAKREKSIIEARSRKQAERVLASQRAGYAKAGVTMEGTPLLVQTETMSEADLDALAIRYAGTIEQSQLIAQQSALRQEAMFEKMRSGQYKTAGYLSAGASLLTGIDKIAGYYAK